MANIPASKSGTVFVDLTQQVKSAQIVRRGYQVPAAKVDVKEVEKVIGNFDIVAPNSLPRVISQSIVAGIKVSAGTAIDLVLAPKSAIPFDLFENIHVAFKGKTVDQVDAIATNTDARKILLSYENPEDVPTADKEALKQVFNNNNVGIDDSKTNTSFNAAFQTMRSAMAFQE
jgi:hypothetical protein